MNQVQLVSLSSVRPLSCVCCLAQAKNYSEALEWYNFSLSFYRAGELDQNLAKLQRNRSTCFLHLHQLEKVTSHYMDTSFQTYTCESCHIVQFLLKAKEAVEKAARIDPSNIFTQFNIYKIAVLESNAEKGNGEGVKSHGCFCKISRGQMIMQNLETSGNFTIARKSHGN